MSTKKTISTICTILLLLVVLAGCASPATPASQPTKAAEATQAPAEATQAPAATEAPVKEAVTLTYMASQGWIKDAELELAKKFEAETGIHVDYQIIPADQYFNVLKTKLERRRSHRHLRRAERQDRPQGAVRCRKERRRPDRTKSGSSAWIPLLSTRSA